MIRANHLSFLAVLATLPACGEPDAPIDTSPIRRVTLRGDDRMRFTPERFTIYLGQKLEIQFENVGKQPVTTMGHNVVILQPGSDVMAFGIAAVGAAAQDYIPTDLRGQVVAHSAVLGPGQSELVEFEPTAIGEYPFVCSFRGHYPTMRGVIRVREQP